MNEKFNFLRERGGQFLENARYNLLKKNLELCAFNIEQACQLYLKYTHGVMLGDFPHVHNLSNLLNAVCRASGNNDLQSFYTDNKILIESIGKAYFDARYYDTPFDKVQVDEMMEFTQNLKNKLEKLWI